MIVWNEVAGLIYVLITQDFHEGLLALIWKSYIIL